MRWCKVSSATLMQEVEAELVALNLDTEQYYALNSTARQFLLICDASENLSDAAQAVSQKFGIPLDRAMVDLRGLLEQLQERGLLRFSAPDAH